MPTESLRVNLAERSYDIEIGADNLADAGRFLADRARTTHVAIVTDDHVHKPHAMCVAESFGELDIEVDVIVVEPGEECKSVEGAAALWQGLLDLGADRGTVVAAVGGGVVGDLAGFVAATFARGLRFLQVPTSLLAQVDSSVGGKVAINLPDAKNIVGAFHQPIGVLIDTATLATLPENEYRAGFGEVVKYGAALDADLFAYLEANAAALLARQPDALAHIISRCCRLKADIVERDEREESGLRAVLNFGHTFGHAFEMASQNERETENSSVNSPHPSPLPRGEGTAVLLHGEAVAIGMICAARLAKRIGRVDDSYTSRLRNLLENFGLPTAPPPFDAERLLDIMANDKKSQRGEPRFVLPTRLGHAELVETVSPNDVRSVLARPSLQ